MLAATRTWLVAFDFSDQSRLALRLAMKHLAALGGGTLTLLHVQPAVPDGVAIDMGGMTPVIMPTDTDASASAERALAEHVAAQRPPEGVMLTQRVTVGRPADTIVEVAAEIGAELIVIGSHGRRGLERMLLGSVAERVLRLSERSVLIVKEPDQAKAAHAERPADAHARDDYGSVGAE